MFSTSLFIKSPPTSTVERYALPSVLQSFLHKDAHSVDPPAISDGAPLITDPTTDVSQLSSSYSPHWLFGSSKLSQDEPESFRFLSRGQRLLYFCISTFCALLFFFLALIFIPLLATPSGLRKFVLMYVLGNVALLFAFAFAFGPWTYFKGLVARDRLLTTMIYGGSLFLGIYGVVWWRNTLCAFLAIGIQVGLGLWQLKRFIWSGTKVISLFTRFPSVRLNNISGFNTSVWKTVLNTIPEINTFKYYVCPVFCW